MKEAFKKKDEDVGGGGRSSVNVKERCVEGVGTILDDVEGGMINGEEVLATRILSVNEDSVPSWEAITKEVELCGGDGKGRGVAVEEANVEDEVLDEVGEGSVVQGNVNICMAEGSKEGNANGEEYCIGVTAE